MFKKSNEPYGWPASRHILLCCLIAFCFSLQFSQVTVADDKVLQLGAPADIPPFYNTDGRGIIPDIIQSALAPYGYTIKVRPMGNTRLVEMLEKGLIDIAPFAVIEAAGVYKSVEYITFFNVAVTKKNRNLKINSVADLAGLKVAAFQGATNVLGSEYKKIVTEEAELYREISKQKNQMKVFWKDRVDAVVLDKLIFDYRSFVTSETKNSPADVTYHTIFGKKTPFAAIFVDEKLRDEFNAGFKRIGASGELTGIYDSYLKPQ